MTPPALPPYRWPDLRGRRVLVVGLGGGADVVTAYALARSLDVGPDGAAVYANTKTRRERDLVPLGRHVATLPGAATPLASLRARNGTTDIDRAMPRGPLGAPWVCLLDGDAGALADDLRAQRFDLLVGVDTGGDALVDAHRGRGGRDRRMLTVLQSVGAPRVLVVVGLGADGQSSREHLAAALDDARDRGRLLGGLPIAPFLEVYREYGPALAPTRTPNVILAAATGGGPDDLVRVPRGARPAVPRSWLASALVLAADP